MSHQEKVNYIIDSVLTVVGVASGADYDDGFDISSFLGNAYNMPVVVEKQQAAQWQLGAWVQ